MLSTARLHYLEAIPEWIVNKEAAAAFDGAVRTRLMRRGPAARRNRIEIINLERDMGLPGRSKVGFDAEVELRVTEFKPSSASRSKSRRLRNLFQPKDIAVEVARLGLTRARYRKLNVVDAEGRHS